MASPGPWSCNYPSESAIKQPVHVSNISKAYPSPTNSKALIEMPNTSSAYLELSTLLMVELQCWMGFWSMEQIRYLLKCSLLLIIVPWLGKIVYYVLFVHEVFYVLLFLVCSLCKGWDELGWLPSLFASACVFESCGKPSGKCALPARIAHWVFILYVINVCFLINLLLIKKCSN